MNSFAGRLSRAFFAVIVGTIVTVFTLSFTFSWLSQPSYDSTRHAFKFRDMTAPFVAQYIADGMSDEEIIEQLDVEVQLQSLLDEIRANGFVSDVDQNDRTIGGMIGEFIDELFDDIDYLIALLIGGLLSVLTSVWLSRQLVRPLADLAIASRALGKSDFTQRVDVEGADEINVLVASFNDMAEQLERNEQVRHIVK